MDLKGKTAIITGASKGIGKSTALALAEKGVNLAISARSEDLLQQTAQIAEKSGIKVFTFNGDMSKEEDIKDFIQQSADYFSGIDILINNAGLGIFKPISELSTTEWDTMFDLNMRGLFIATREALPHLRETGESVIVNVSSLAGKNAFVGGGGYAATKHALMGFSRCLMQEERKNGVRVLAICPGSVETSFSLPDMNIPESERKRKLMPEDVADSIIHMITQPQRAMVSEIDIRPSNP